MAKKKIAKKQPRKTPSRAKLKKAAAGVSEGQAQVKASEPLQPPRGMRDILPAEERYWHLLQAAVEQLSRSFGYGWIETPILEHRNLFARAIGEGTDIVSKEMYTFRDQGGDELVLRPEATAAVARAYINHGMLNLPQPVKLWYCGPFFRHEKPQAGRYRQFHQWGLEILGDAHPVLDAEVILIVYTLFQELNLPVIINLNSLGCTTCRLSYKTELINFYQGKRELLCAACKERLERNPLRMLDCKEAQCEMLREGAPILIDFLCDACREHFMRVLEYLDEVAVPYTLNNYLVRGLDYYSRTVFEVFPNLEAGGEKLGVGESEKNDLEGEKREDKDAPEEKVSRAQSALGGGGRYDDLIEMLGGRPTPAVGCSLGLERIINYIKGYKPTLSVAAPPKVFIAQLGDGARRKAMILWADLRRVIPCVAALSKDGLKTQLEIANRLGVRFAIIIGQKEIMDGTAIVRDMEAGIQEIVDFNKVVGDIKKKLGNGG